MEWFFSTKPVVQAPTFEVVTQEYLVLEIIYIKKSKFVTANESSSPGLVYTSGLNIFSTKPVVQVPTFEVVTQESLVLEVTYMRKSKLCYHKWIISPTASIHKWNEFFLQGQLLKYLHFEVVTQELCFISQFKCNGLHDSFEILWNITIYFLLFFICDVWPLQLFINNSVFYYNIA